MRRMRPSRRTLAWMAVLGLVIGLGLGVIQHRRGDTLAADHADGASRGIDAALAAPQLAPAATPASEPRAASTAGAGNEAGTCAQTLDDAAAFAARESSAANPVEVPEADSEDWLPGELGRAKRSLAGSGNPEHFLAAFLLEQVEARSSAPNASSAYTTLADLGARAANPDSPLLAWHALLACHEAKQSCPYAHLEQRLLEAQRQNAESWALVAALRYGRGDSAGALAAMQGAARAPTSTWHWGETMALIERTLAAQTSMPYAARMSHAFGVGAAATLPRQTELLQMCRVESATSRAWGEACLAFGTLRGERNDTDLARALSYSIRGQVLTALGDAAGAAEVAAERALYDAERTAGELSTSRGKLLTALIEADPARLHAYFGAMQRFGEVAGYRAFLRQELPPLLDRAGLLKREGVQECAAQLFAPLVAAGTRAATAGHRIQVADQLLVSVRGGRSLSTTVQVRPDGTIAIPRIPGIAALDKTTEQIEHDIAAMLHGRNPPSEVLVILMSPRSREDLRLEFDNARRETAQAREESR